MRAAPSLLFPMIAGGLALGGAGALAGVLRTRAAAVSHELPAATRSVARPDQPTPVLVARGRQLFLHSCAHCHGNDARGDEGPDLHDLQVSDRRIASVITTGIKGEMPSFAKKHGAEEIAALVVYLRTLE